MPAKNTPGGSTLIWFGTAGDAFLCLVLHSTWCIAVYSSYARRRALCNHCSYCGMVTSSCAPISTMSSSPSKRYIVDGLSDNPYNSVPCNALSAPPQLFRRYSPSRHPRRLHLCGDAAQRAGCAAFSPSSLRETFEGGWCLQANNRGIQKQQNALNLAAWKVAAWTVQSGGERRTKALYMQPLGSRHAADCWRQLRPIPWLAE